MNPNPRKSLHIGIAVVVLILGVVGLKVLIASKPEIDKALPKVSLPAVKTVPVVIAPQAIRISGQGTVQPERQIQLIPQVSGKIVEISPSLVNGGVFQQGETLLCIDPADYRIAVTLAEASVKDAESRFKLAEEEAQAAQYEWDQLHPDTQAPSLVAKEPQLAAARALLDGDKANLEKARLQLERTRLTAPFDGRVGQKQVDVGQYVTPGQSLATLYATDAVEIVLPMETQDLHWFHVPGFTPGEGAGAEAEVCGNLAGYELTWHGRVVRAEGALDPSTRMVNVVVKVDKPYERKPPLAIGMFATVHIKGRTLESAARIPRAAIRENRTVWVVDESGRLEFRPVDIVRFTTQGVIIGSGLQEGEQVVISPIKAVSDGMQVRRVTERNGEDAS